jgi:hypothetical protein
MIEDEIIHWWKDDNDGSNHKTVLRLESERPNLVNSFPRDGKVVVRLINTIGSQAIKLSPDEALRVSTLLMTISRELIDKKRKMWKKTDE